MDIVNSASKEGILREGDRIILLIGFGNNIGVSIDEAAYTLCIPHIISADRLLVFRSGYIPPVVKSETKHIRPNGSVPIFKLTNISLFDWAKDDYKKLTGEELLSIRLDPYIYFGDVAHTVLELENASLSDVVNSLEDRKIKPYEVFAALNVMSHPDEWHVDLGSLLEISGKYPNVEFNIVDGVGEKDIEQFSKKYHQVHEWAQEKVRCTMGFDNSIALSIEKINY